jgi:CubicO group peptidase (beta-lactamase class C family)
VEADPNLLDMWHSNIWVKAACAGLAIVTAVGTSASAQTPTHSAAIDAYVSTLADAGHVSGTLLVARGRDIIFEKSYGRADYNGGVANTPATLFAIASLTKPMTGIATRLLAERGVLGLEDPVARWIPDFPNGSRITIAHLLAHRSGLPHRVTRLEDELKPQTAESMSRVIAGATLVFEPGAQRLYSSAGYSVVARVLELATGKSYATLLRELVLAPADATTAVDATESELETRPRAKGHYWTPQAPLPTPARQLSYLVGAGSLWATPRDLFKVARRVVDGGYSGASTEGARAANGTIQWTGWSSGSQAILNYDPATDVTLIFVGNVLTGAIDWIARDVPRILAGVAIAIPTLPKPTVVSLSPAQQKRLEGVYNYFGAEQQLTFVSPSSALLGGEYFMLATGENSLYAPLNYADLVVVSDSTGRVSSLQFRGTSLSMPRVR